MEMWAITWENGLPNAVCLRTEPFEDDFYVEPGQALCGVVSSKCLFRSREEAISSTALQLITKKKQLELQIDALEAIR